ncbi:hypothetical protein [Alicyclobacillus sp. SP_1]|uniref:hypothetical protein n=1 Tax=Alicyclobacillus sp. SP_1 TaxID=2942475 RepID=UPI0021581BF3|nr:hypothetical protein [Alicyclobacillus sp. SP_1]
MDDEERYHLEAALLHLLCLRDLLWRTGAKEALDTCGWPYGLDGDGGDGEPIFAGQLETLLELIGVDLQAELHFDYTENVEMWEDLRLLRGDWTKAATWCFVWFSSSDPETLETWRHFLFWIRQSTDDAWYTQDDASGFGWAIAEPADDVLMDAWSSLIAIWEVENYYGHVADARAWRRLRGFPDPTDGTEDDASTEDCGERRPSL